MANSVIPSSKEGDAKREQQTLELLAQLNEWEQQYGAGFRSDPGLKDKGEANARIQDLKAKLHALGARYRWDGSAYVLDAPAEPE